MLEFEHVLKAILEYALVVGILFRDYGLLFPYQFISLLLLPHQFPLQVTNLGLLDLVKPLRFSLGLLYLLHVLVLLVLEEHDAIGDALSFFVRIFD